MAPPAPRYDIHLPVILTLADSQRSVVGTSENISETGVLIRAEEIAPLRSVLHLDFSLFSATAEVIWSREVEDESAVLLGMKFIELSREHRGILLRLLESPDWTEHAASGGG